MTNSGIAFPREVVLYAAQECEWQRSGEMSVANMLDAWTCAYSYRSSIITEEVILALAALIEPKKNADGYRKVGVRVGYDVKMHHSLVPDAMKAFILRLSKILPGSIPLPIDLATLLFFDFENIHPFVDGNGRLGTLLYNLCLGTLRNPVHVPNLWDDPRR